MIPSIPQSIQGHKTIAKLYKINQNSTIHTPTQISSETTKPNVNNVALPGRNSSPPGDSTQNKPSYSPLMSRLAVRIKPPGGFWEKPRNPIKQCGK